MIINAAKHPLSKIDWEKRSCPQESGFMLVHILALAVAAGSFTFYMAAFFFPEAHRKHDFFWSGLGMFYALVLWACAGQIRGAVLLAQLTSVVLLLVLAWETLMLRRARTPVELQTPNTPSAWAGFGTELTDLLLKWFVKSPLGGLAPTRWRKRAAVSAARQSPGGGLRASSVRDVGYEYLDDLEEEEGPPITLTRSSARQPQAPSSSPSGQDMNLDSPVSPKPRPCPVDKDVDRTDTSSKNAGPAAATSPKSVSSTSRSQSSGPSRPPQPSPPASPRKRTGSVQPPSSQGNLLTKLIIIKDWLVEVVGSLRKPKPKRPVIDIPPRPSPLSRGEQAREEQVREEQSPKEQVREEQAKSEGANSGDTAPQGELSENALSGDGESPADNTLAQSSQETSPPETMPSPPSLNPDSEDDDWNDLDEAFEVN